MNVNILITNVWSNDNIFVPNEWITHTHTQNETCIHFGIMKCMKQITIYRNKKKFDYNLCVCVRDGQNFGSI